jgi:hypothetical protein
MTASSTAVEADSTANELLFMPWGDPTEYQEQSRPRMAAVAEGHPSNGRPFGRVP